MNARRAGLVVLVLALIVGGVVVTRMVTQSDQEDIFLEGAGQTGRNPFTIAAITPTTTSLPAVTTTTALFGGSGDQRRCDPEGLIAFLTTNLDKATAWVGALNSDPTLRWGEGGTKTSLTVADIPDYIRTELTPTFLSADTRVTNHGYVNGKAVPHQSVLQAGTAVLVDKMGIPRARCACGNPLIPPHKVDNPHYNGDCWEGCHDHPYCDGPQCTDPTTTTSASTSTTLEVTTTTSGTPLRTTTTRRPTVVTSTTLPPVTRTTTTTIPATTTSITVIPQ